MRPSLNSSDLTNPFFPLRAHSSGSSNKRRRPPAIDSALSGSTKQSHLAIRAANVSQAFHVGGHDQQTGVHGLDCGNDLRKRLSRELWTAWRRVGPVAAEEYVLNLTDEERAWLAEEIRWPDGPVFLGLLLQPRLQFGNLFWF
ncbi:hypothetical protein OAN94_05615 [Verrucomicrobiales bacterium]|nr:hypothetical protein [Verrucomicrobiales bacterium]MDB2347918.1 hypothetical protein [Verrucomicrobiales bacterium]MDC0503735.1 hypothetical protein [Verrucomicrobiales bacterium]MDF1785912.1 hypothetical protein [Verrucomicrobiales bacterium]